MPGEFEVARHAVGTILGIMIAAKITEEQFEIPFWKSCLIELICFFMLMLIAISLAYTVNFYKLLNTYWIF